MFFFSGLSIPKVHPLKEAEHQYLKTSFLSAMPVYDAVKKSTLLAFQDMFTKVTTAPGATASDPHLDLSRAPYVLYGVTYIDLVSLAPVSGQRYREQRGQFKSGEVHPPRHNHAWRDHGERRGQFKPERFLRSLLLLLPCRGDLGPRGHTCVGIELNAAGRPTRTTALLHTITSCAKRLFLNSFLA